jgi:dinuclear metal center YbgI/SA1388 family protein
MTTLAQIAQFLDRFAPPELAEAWDNVGLLLGDSGQTVRRLMTCLTITPTSAAEAVEERADLILTHHPLPFRELKRITTHTPQGRLLLTLLSNRVAVYSPHTAFDSAAQGINQRLAEGLGLREIMPLRPHAGSTDSGRSERPPGAAQASGWQPDDGPTGWAAIGPAVGGGRFGKLPRPISLAALARRVKRFLNIPRLQGVGDWEQAVQVIGVACGSGGEFLAPAVGRGCQCLVTGETRFHTCLEAEAQGLALLLVGHYASERFGAEFLAEVVAQEFAGLTVWASRRECDPLRFI